MPTAEDCAVLAREKGVRRMISLLSESSVPDDVKQAAAASGIRYEFYPLLAEGTDPEQVRVDRAKVRSLVEELRRAGDGTTYVHCRTGRNTSAVVNFTYRMTVDGKSYADALIEVIQRGFQGTTHQGLIEDLKLLAAGLDALPPVPIMPIDDSELLGRGTRVNAGAIRLHTKSLGEGPPLYAVHGGPGESHLIMRPYLDALAEDHTLVYFDQRGCGYSDRPPFREAYSIARLVEDLEALRAALGHEKISLIAQSSGGPVAARYALAYPERVDKLIIVSSWASAEEFSQTARYAAALIAPEDLKVFTEISRTLGAQQRDPNDDELSALQKCMYPTQFFGRLTPEFRKDWSRRAQVSSMAWQALDGEYTGSRGTKDALDLRPDLPKITDTPTLVIAGKYDVVTPPQVVRTYADGIPGARFEVMDLCGHYPYVEQNEAFLTLVRGFLAE
jgi:proline iminopeptidase